MRTVKDVLKGLDSPTVKVCSTPKYKGDTSNGIALAVEDMRRHTADAGWQIMQALREGGYPLCGFNLPPNDMTDVVRLIQTFDPGVMVVQDKREWDIRNPRSWREQRARFENVQVLRKYHDIFKLTILKDAHQEPLYHKQSADEMGVHAWIIYYHPDIVKHVAPYVRLEHCIRTYHTLEPSGIPAAIAHKQNRCLFSGAVSLHYPLRTMIKENLPFMPLVDCKVHPGYHNKGCVCYEYFNTLNTYKVAICTSSMYGYTLRKHIEATACGCRVITDLPVDDPLPKIDGNMIRVPSNISAKDLNKVVKQAIDEYDLDTQNEFALAAKRYYDWRSSGLRLVRAIEEMRKSY